MKSGVDVECHMAITANYDLAALSHKDHYEKRGAIIDKTSIVHYDRPVQLDVDLSDDTNECLRVFLTIEQATELASALVDAINRVTE